MTAPSQLTETLPDKGPIQVKPGPEGHAGLEYVMEFFHPKYTSKASVLVDYSLTACIEMRRRGIELGQRVAGGEGASSDVQS